LDVELFDRFRDAFGLPLLDGLGSTEALHHVTSNRPDDVVPGSAGRALDGYEVRVLDRDGQPLPEGDHGELWVRGPTTFAGYWRRPELTERAYQGEWMRTGDRVRILDGRVYHAGRLDDLVKLGGIWVAPTEIEDVLRGHEDVSDAAVVAIDDGSGVPVLRAFVVSERSGKDLSRDLLRLCRSRLASFKIPQSFEVVDELPRTPSGKLRRFVLRQGTESQSVRS
jgi:acyl-coenzyme A synthetase/AMP-(fatty) acid ligase